MEKSRSRNTQIKRNEQYIIPSKRFWLKELLVIVFSALVWLYCLLVVLFFTDAIFGLNLKLPTQIRNIFQMSSAEVRQFTFMIIGLFVLVVIIIYVWSVYNKKRYGKLKRRKQPLNATKNDLLKLDMIDEKTYDLLQKTNYIRLKKNPIKRKSDKT